MNPQYLKKHMQTPSINSFTMTHKNQNSNFGQTQRKSIAGSLNKSPLADVTNNHPEFKSHKKHSLYDISARGSTQIFKTSQKPSSSNIAATKWLDSEKEMMEFIINLKSKKSGQKTTKQKKITQGFQIDERAEQTQSLLCNKMLLIKKVQKYEKEAINLFYQKDYQKCFNELSKAEALIRRQKIETVQHQLYINYLYSEFYYKLNDFQKWKCYLNKARQYVFKINSVESEALKEYVMNISALQVCLACHEEQFDKVISLSDNLINNNKISSKIRRRISNSRITAFQKLYKFKEAMEAIDRECEALQIDNQINSERQTQQIGKLLALKIQLTAQCTNTEKAIQLLQKIINFIQVANGNASNFSHYHIKIFQLYAELLKKDKINILKTIFFYQKWVEIQTSKKQKLKIELELFKMYYEIGVYERALELFDEISSENIIYLGPEYLYILARIKHSYGQRKEAANIMMKIIDLSQNEDSKILNSFRILEFDLEEENSSLRSEYERVLQQNLKTYDGPNHQVISDLYCEYLHKFGDHQKAKMFANKMKKTANFQQFYFNNEKSQKKLTKK